MMKWRRANPKGRPRVAPEMRSMSLYLPKPLFDRVQRQAIRRNMSMNAMARDWFSLMLEVEEGDDPFEWDTPAPVPMRPE